jgi:hypothetical protein
VPDELIQTQPHESFGVGARRSDRRAWMQLVYNFTGTNSTIGINRTASRNGLDRGQCGDRLRGATTSGGGMTTSSPTSVDLISDSLNHSIGCS